MQVAKALRRFLVERTNRALGRPGSIDLAPYIERARAVRSLQSKLRGIPDAQLSMQVVESELAVAEPSDTVNLRFAFACESLNRALAVELFEEQVVAALALVDGIVVEMDTGEGKTFAGALAAAVQALRGRKVHVLSVNDYLAARDAEWLKPFFERLEITSSFVVQSSSTAERRAAYDASVTFVPVSEVGYDLLRDRFAVASDERVEPVFDFAIVDEADAILVDDAAVPLVLAGTSEAVPPDLDEALHLARSLDEPSHFRVDDERATVSLTDAGLDHLEAQLGGRNLYTGENSELLTQVNLALHSLAIMRRDVDYIVKDGSIQLINASRGRVAERQRWPDGLQAAVEVNEGLPVSDSGVILDSITVQELMASYASLAGMSGTSLAVAEELEDYYGVKSVMVPRRLSNARVDHPERVYATAAQKDAVLVEQILTLHAVGTPILVGTQSVAESEVLAAKLREAGIRLAVLNAKNDEEEADLVAAAGIFGAVTISTQMSGRGVDIQLGGPEELRREEILALGGLAVLATSRFPNRRLDAQLRGRAGRQGDPGSSTSFASLEDAIVELCAPPHLRVESQREGSVMEESRRKRIVDWCQDISEGIALDAQRATRDYNRAISSQRASVLARRLAVQNSDVAFELISRLELAAVGGLMSKNPDGDVRLALRRIMLFEIDQTWHEHLAELSQIRDGIHLRALAGERPAEAFHQIALREFAGFYDAVDEAASDFARALDPHDMWNGVGALEARRPSSTWNYMVTDNPLGMPQDRLVQSLARKFQRARGVL